MKKLYAHLVQKKCQIYDLYLSRLTYRVIKNDLADIIQEDNENSNIKNKSINLNVFAEFYMIHGLPSGYELSEELDSQIKDYLKRKTLKINLHKNRLKK